ncbi:MAG: hypothetical protein AB8B57_09325 [Congregibacter sp.]
MDPGSPHKFAVFAPFFAVLALALLLASPAQAQQMYRYTNAEGSKVIGYQVPPAFVANGYDILSPTGALLSVVPKQLDDTELSDMDSQARREREALKEQERLRKWDESLLLRYSSIEDIEAARERALRNLRIRVSILNGKLRSLKQQIENYQSIAANMERVGSEADESHLTAIADLRREIDSTERALADRQQEIASVDESYDLDISRFADLLDIVRLRRGMAAGRRSES